MEPEQRDDKAMPSVIRCAACGAWVDYASSGKIVIMDRTNTGKRIETAYPYPTEYGLCAESRKALGYPDEAPFRIVWAWDYVDFRST